MIQRGEVFNPAVKPDMDICLGDEVQVITGETLQIGKGKPFRFQITGLNGQGDVQVKIVDQSGKHPL